MTQPLRVLIVDDSEADAILLLRALRHGGYEVAHAVVDDAAAMRAALERADWDVITSDHAMPHFSAPGALAVAKELRPELPFIIVSGEIDLGLAVSLVKEGAYDYIQKHQLPRLSPTIDRALRDARIRRERRQVHAALEASEHRYRRLFETAQDGILLIDAVTGELLDVNPFLIGMLGYSKQHFLGKRLWEIGAFQDIQASKNAFGELQRKGYVRCEDLQLETSAGQRINVEFISNVYPIDHSKVAQCNIRDITARKQAEAEIRKRNTELEQRVKERTAQLEALNEELQAFNYSVSHDLRAPLRWISGFAEALQQDHAEEQSADSLRLLQKISASAERMNGLIDALLQMAHFSRGEFKRQTVDLSAIVRRIAAELQQGQPVRQVEFAIAEGITASGDEGLLLIVLENLLGNSWKFTARRACARIEFGAAPQSDGTVAYFVRDNGAGFDMTHAGRLFSTFQRLHGENEFPGIGIGLATVRRIVHRHEGRIWAEGVAGKGAAFYFTVGKA